MSCRIVFCCLVFCAVPCCAMLWFLFFLFASWFLRSHVVLFVFPYVAPSFVLYCLVFCFVISVAV